MTTLVTLGAVAVAAVAWFALFDHRFDEAWAELRGDRPDTIWTRSWVVAGALVAYSLFALVVTMRLYDVLGPIGPWPVLAGIGVGGGWLAATHVGHDVLRRLVPGFVDEVQDLYGHGAGDPASVVVGPLLAMALAEELLFRGVIQSGTGFVVALAVYTAVQAVERKWALVLAGFLCGVVWGGLFAVTGGIVAPLLAHAIWTVGLTVVWPLQRDTAGPPVRSEVQPFHREDLMPAAGDRVRVHYTGRFPDGTVFDTSEGRDPLEFAVGSGEIIPGLDHAILDMAEGEAQTVTIEPADAYGEREEALVHSIERTQLPEGTTEGTALQAQVDGQQAILWVTEIGEATATVDANHPLAGRTLVFDVELVEVVAA